jgi:hypothetical protein
MEVTRLSYTGLDVELENLKIETRLTTSSLRGTGKPKDRDEVGSTMTPSLIALTELLKLQKSGQFPTGLHDKTLLR